MNDVTRASERQRVKEGSVEGAKGHKGVERRNIFHVDFSALAGAIVPYDSRDHPADALDRKDRSHGGHAHLSVFRGHRYTRPASRTDEKKEKKKKVWPPDTEIFRGKCAI